MISSAVKVIEIEELIIPTLNLTGFNLEDFIRLTNDSPKTHQAIIKLPCGKEISVHKNPEKDLLLFDNAITTWTAWAIELACKKCPKQKGCFENFFISPPN